MLYQLRILIVCVAWLLVAAGGTNSSAAPPPAAAEAYNITPWRARGIQLIELEGTVVNVVDGDTIDVKVLVHVEVRAGSNGRHRVDGFTREIAAEDWLPIVVRLRVLADTTGRGCWAPESRTLDLAEKKRGQAAKINMEKLALGKECTVIVPAHGYELKDYMSLERVLAVAKVNGKSLGEAQIKAKHASSTKGGRPGV